MGAFSEFDQLQQQFDRLWDRLAGSRPGHPHFRQQLWEPPTDIYQTSDTVVVVLEVGGMRGQDVELSISDDRLTIRGERRDPHQGSDRVYAQMEMPCGPFERTVTLPAGVDGERAEVRYEDGLLEIALPKRQLVAPRRLRVTVREGQ